jgi:hypothetical protein
MTVAVTLRVVVSNICRTSAEHLQGLVLAERDEAAGHCRDGQKAGGEGCGEGQHEAAEGLGTDHGVSAVC